MFRAHFGPCVALAASVTGTVHSRRGDPRHRTVIRDYSIRHCPTVVCISDVFSTNQTKVLPAVSSYISFWWDLSLPDTSMAASWWNWGEIIRDKGHVCGTYKMVQFIGKMCLCHSIVSWKYKHTSIHFDPWNRLHQENEDINVCKYFKIFYDVNKTSSQIWKLCFLAIFYEKYVLKMLWLTYKQITNYIYIFFFK